MFLACLQWVALATRSRMHVIAMFAAGGGGSRTTLEGSATIVHSPAEDNRSTEARISAAGVHAVLLMPCSASIELLRALHAVSHVLLDLFMCFW